MGPRVCRSLAPAAFTSLKSGIEVVSLFLGFLATGVAMNSKSSVRRRIRRLIVFV